MLIYCFNYRAFSNHSSNSQLFQTVHLLTRNIYTHWSTTHTFNLFWLFIFLSNSNMCMYSNMIGVLHSLNLSLHQHPSVNLTDKHSAPHAGGTRWWPSRAGNIEATSSLQRPFIRFVSSSLLTSCLQGFISCPCGKLWRHRRGDLVRNAETTSWHDC